MTTNAPTTSSQSTTVSDRTGTKLIVKRRTKKETLGDFVTDVTMNPFVAPRIISFAAYNMRPNTRMHIFFDGVNIDKYCAPSIRNDSNNYTTSVSTGNDYKINNTADYKSIPKQGDWGSAIYSDSRGIVAGQFNVPEKVFRTGERVMQITDVESLQLGKDAHTTISSATFVATNLTVTKSTLTLTTITPELSFQEVTDQVIGVGKAKGILDVSVYYEPLAQVMTINTPNNEAGIFITSLDIFFKKKPESFDLSTNFYPNGVTVYICEVDNGYPNGKSILPFSTVHKNWPEIVISSNASAPTKFTFEAPVYLSNNKEYAFIVKPDNNDPDYHVWTANLGDTDVGTGYQVFSQPILGTAFYGATMNQWTALPTEYVKFVLRRAEFSGTSAKALFENSDVDFLTIKNLSYSNTSVGLLPGDVVFQSNTPSTNVSGVFISNSGTGYSANATVTLTFANASTNTGYVNTTVGTTGANVGRVTNLNIVTSLTGITGGNPTLTVAAPSAINITANTTGFSNTADVILVSSANSRFQIGDKLYYSVPTNNTAIGGLTGNAYYYVSFVNSSAMALSGTANGSNINITDNRTTNPGQIHTIQGMTASGYVLTQGYPSVGLIDSTRYGFMVYYNSERNIMQIEESTGLFTSNSFIQIHRFPTSNISAPNTSTLIAYANTGELHNPIIDAWVTQIAAITPPGTDLTISYTGTANNYIKETVELPTNIGYETEFKDMQRIVASKSNEMTNMAGAKSVTMTANLVTDSSYLSPLIDTAKYYQLVIANQIDPIEFKYEEFLANGGSKSKYISKVITLADGQEAEDIQVIITAHRPVATDVQVWVKFLSNEDSETLDQKTWTPLINNKDTMYSDPTNEEDYKEFLYTMPKYYSLIPTTGTITASNSSVSVTGSGTLFDSELQVGWFINMRANSTFSESTRKIVAIQSNTSLTLDLPFNGSYPDNPYFLVPPPTTAWMSRNTAKRVTGNVTVSSTNTYIVGNSYTINTSTSVNISTDSLLISSASSYFTIGDKVFYQVPTANVAVGGLTGNSSYYIKSVNSTAVTLSETSTSAAIDLTSNGTGTHALCTTNFTNEVRVGDYIYVAGDQQYVVGISNATHLSLATPWTSDAGNQKAYLATRAGLTYYNSTYSAFTSYKRFQIKIILQSDVSARVPILDDLRALALQL